ncbi:hypothetical protein CTRI78_v000075 [Colletotrichum trifolii]|uniref:Uncharacterized protein n=1 Tax=Colletotrichum trifolii TaxID=5466 RepID=A0A4R8RSR1_COLTR|nr:hypothetical protein CTRI78_v000075 [Colletotrichum trifolii]
MAEAKTKPVVNGINGVNGTGNAKPSFKATKLYETLRSIISSTNIVKDELDSLPDLEKLLKNEKRLRQEIEDKNAELDSIKKEKDKELAQKAKEVDQIRKDAEEKIRSAREDMDRDMTKLKQGLEAEKHAQRVLVERFEERFLLHSQTEADGAATSQKLAETQRQLKTKENEVAAKQARVSELEHSSERALLETKTLETEKARFAWESKRLSADLQARDAALNIASSDLQQLKDDVGLQRLKNYDDREIDKFRNQLEAYAAEARNLVTEFFRDPDSSLNSVKLPHFDFPKPLPLPKNGSTPALRCLFAQAFIAHHIRSQIFQAFFLPSDRDVDRAGLDILNYLSEDVQRATIFRCQILAVCDRPDVGKAVAEQATEEVFRYLYPLVPPVKCVSLKARLLQLFEKGVDMWKAMQCSERLIVCDDVDDEDVDDVDESQRPGMWDEYGSVVRAGGAPRKGNVLATLFPQVVMEESEQMVHVIHPGVAIWEDQAVVVDALRALSRGPANGRVNGDGARPTSGRRRSISNAPSARG